MNTETVRSNFTMPADVKLLLDQTGNASEYISTSVRERWRRWTRALAIVGSSGWKASEIFAACEALNGTDMLDMILCSGRELSAALTKWTDLGNAKNWELVTRHWHQRIHHLRDDATNRVALALALVVREVLSGNQAIKAELKLWQEEGQ